MSQSSPNLVRTFQCYFCQINTHKQRWAQTQSIAFLSVCHHTSAPLLNATQETTQGQVNAYCMCEHKAAWIPLFCNCAQQPRGEKTGPLRCSSSVPTASMSVSIYGGKPNSKSTALCIRVSTSRRCKQTYEWKEAMAICLVWQDEVRHYMHTCTDVPQNNWHHKLFPLKL